MEFTASQLSYTYPRGENPALDQVDVCLVEGITGLVGVNGAGKSTLLRILARIISPNGGVIALDGANVRGVSRRAIAGRIGYMPQEFSLPHGARVLDSLLYLAWLKGLSGAKAKERCRELLGELALADRADAKVSTLSGGMVRRLALAQAILTRPEVLLLDEPTTGLDPEQRLTVRELLRDERFRAGITLVSSHVMEDVEALADRVVLLDGGSVVFTGSLTEFRLAPDGIVEDAEAAFVRRLVGVRR